MEKSVEEWCPEHITTGFVASYCGVSKTTVLRWIKNGRLSAFRLPEGHYRMQRERFAEFLARHSMPLYHKMSKNKNKSGGI